MEYEYDYDFIFNQSNQLKFFRFCTHIDVFLFKLTANTSAVCPQEMMEEFLTFNEER